MNRIVVTRRTTTMCGKPYRMVLVFSEEGKSVIWAWESEGFEHSVRSLLPNCPILGLDTTYPYGQRF